ncbi:MAG: tRNA preQ1(34) S-adenosylmethionine ribosyltransferase-isomerase QueA [Bacilli bacterium]|nr:tRNA preQ1(34) S-adenosylmethionine ribosyltransferase-isomerase QueA [Bacilli bacterium]
MKVSDFDYPLDESLIAQTPLEKRDESKLMVMDRKTGDIEHKKFYNIIDYLNKGDVLVLNDTKVIPARLIGEKVDTKAVIEILMLKDLGKNIWECLVKPAKRIKVGTIVEFGNGLLKAECIKVRDEGIREFKLIYEGILMEILDKLGEMPLPPYIHEKLLDKDRYQTVYAKNIGSAAAPTAGLHFTNELLERIQKKGVKIEFVTLHVGLGTFRPVMVDDIKDHSMHTEYYSMSKKTAKVLNNAKKNGNKIIAVGTTSTRTLETIMTKYGEFKECSGNTNIFIYPGYNFKGIDALITNFHLPKSTLVMLVSAFSKKEFIINAYIKAQENNYRFFSFGDAMLIK